MLGAVLDHGIVGRGEQAIPFHVGGLWTLVSLRGILVSFTRLYHLARLVPLAKACRLRCRRLHRASSQDACREYEDLRQWRKTRETAKRAISVADVHGLPDLPQPSPQMRRGKTKVLYMPTSEYSVRRIRSATFVDDRAACQSGPSP